MEGRATTAPRCALASTRPEAQRLPHRRARYLEAPRDVGFVERCSRRQRAAHDFVCQLQAQFLGAGDLVRMGRSAIDAPNHRRLIGGTRWSAGRNIVKTHVF
jgi:hypothetical protein